MTVEIELTSVQPGATTFDLYSNVDGFVVPFETGIDVALLTAGYITNLVPNGTVTIKVQSVGSSCANFINLVLATTTTTTTTTEEPTTTTTTSSSSSSTTTTTTSTTEAVTYYGLIEVDDCADTNGQGYGISGTIGTIGDTVYLPDGVTVFNGGNSFYRLTVSSANVFYPDMYAVIISNYIVEIDNVGEIISIITC